MKVIYIILHKLAGMLKRNVFISIVFCTSIFICGIMCAYFYGNMKGAIREMDAVNYYIYNPNEISFDNSALDGLDITYYMANSDFTDIILLDSSELSSSVIPNFIAILIPGNIDTEKAEDSYHLIYQTFGDGFRIETHSRSNEEQAELEHLLFFVLLLYVLSMLSLMYQVTYLLDDFAVELNIYEIVGATYGKLLIILSGVFGILLFIISIASQVVHYLFRNFFDAINLFNITYYMGDYIVTIFITVFSIFVFLFTFLCIRVKHSAIANKNRFAV